jgi:50S ribosomal protein L16 3-hydroxylase
VLPARRYGDAGARPTRSPGRLPSAFVRAAYAALAKRRPTLSDARDTLLVFLTEPKQNVVFEQPRRALAPAALRTSARRAGLRLDRRSRMLYADGMLALNGELLPVRPSHRVLMHSLADQRSLLPAQLARLDTAAWTLLAEWHGVGWLHLG